MEHFKEQPDSTHIVIYGNGSGELLVTYWPSLEKAEKWRDQIVRLGEKLSFDPSPRVALLADEREW